MKRLFSEPGFRLSYTYLPALSCLYRRVQILGTSPFELWKAKMDSKFNSTWGWVRGEISFCQVYYLCFSWLWPKGSWGKENFFWLVVRTQSTLTAQACGVRGGWSMQLGLLTLGKPGIRAQGISGITFTLCTHSWAPAHGTVPAKIRVGLPSSVKVSGKSLPDIPRSGSPRWLPIRAKLTMEVSHHSRCQIPPKSSKQTNK